MRDTTLSIVILICCAGCSGGAASSGGESGGDAAADAGTMSPHDAGDGGSDASPTDAARDTSAPDAGHASCTQWCARAAVANCPAQGQCASGCANLVALSPAACASELQAMLDCGATMGTFACDGSGLPMLTGGCDSAATAWLSCLQGDAGAPDGSADDGGATCNDNFTSGNEACDSCFQAACCPQLMTCAADGICTSNVVCAMFCNGDATCENNCVEQDANSYPSSVAEASAAFGCMRSSCGATCGF